MNIAVRTDASVQLGSGHVMRCLTLADRLRRRGATVVFVCREGGGSLCDFIASMNYVIHRLPAQDCLETKLDAERTMIALRQDAPIDWLVVDHYGLDRQWETALRAIARRIMVVDDLADRQHDCDVLLDQNYSTDGETRYQNLVPASCRCLLGPRYALLCQKYAVYHNNLLDVISDQQTQNNLSSLGGNLGAWRVAEYIDPTPVELLRLRLAQPNDAALYFDWVNDVEVRRQSLNSDPVSWQTHQEWFCGKLADPHCRLFVLEAGALPVGQVRFDLVGDEARIDYSLDRVVRGRRWGGRLIGMGVSMLQDSVPIHLRAEVKETNMASCAVFMRLGFEDQLAPPQGVRVFRSVSTRIAAVGSTTTSPISSLPGWRQDTGCYGRTP